MAGEQLHQRGADGARRAKLWLEATTRANVYYVTPEPVAVAKLSYRWADGGSFSYDLGGVLLGGEFQGHEFVAESKFYDGHHDQGTLYVEFLAKCYRALTLQPTRIDHFMWITWAPFLVTRWSDLRSPGEIRSAVKLHRGRVFGSPSNHPVDQISDETCELLAERLWIIVLSERQEKLVISTENLSILRAVGIERGAG
ncbi:hypothetical protein Ga0074812_13721 [Parafrankia irregularis]|uniref:Uncharacterized protein n=1 Tax=Parafrankia irregularis TaxID=795642 RepID=A0A0S4QXH6_9ACTN|nr:hypothetical protein [Parafrankia sp. CH37]CUU60237.1 hypothetical protein Ga0074812_13721 [Parafrankia irregularis]